MSGTTVSGCVVASGVAAEPMSETVVLRGPERPDLLRLEVLADIFEATAAAHPEQIALMEGQGDQLRQRSYAQLVQALRQLPARQREAFSLRVLQDLDVATTAKAMGCSEGSVKTHLSRARDALQKQLEATR